MRASQGTGRNRPRSGPDGSFGCPSASWYRSARNADQPLPEAAPSSAERQAPPAWQRCRQVRGTRHPAPHVHHHRPAWRRGRDHGGGRLLVPGEGPPGPQEDPGGDRVRPADGRVGPDRRGPAGPPRLRPPGGGELRPDPARPGGRHDGDRGQDVLGELGLRSLCLRVRGRRHAAGQRPWRLHDHPAARPKPAPAQGVRGRGRRPLPEEAPRDHPVDQADRGLSRPGRQAADHGVVPQQQLLRQPELRRRRRRPELLEEGSQGPHAGPVRDPCRHPQVSHRL